MATEKEMVISDSRTAAENLDAFIFVKLNGSGAIVSAEEADVPWGVLQEPLSTGQTGLVMQVGVTKLISAGVITEGADIGPNADGHALAKTTADDRPVGRACEGAADNDVFRAAINCLTPSYIVGA